MLLLLIEKFTFNTRIELEEALCNIKYIKFTRTKINLTPRRQVKYARCIFFELTSCREDRVTGYGKLDKYIWLNMDKVCMGRKIHLTEKNMTIREYNHRLMTCPHMKISKSVHTSLTQYK
jgi:hypothetical protein